MYRAYVPLQNVDTFYKRSYSSKWRYVYCPEKELKSVGYIDGYKTPNIFTMGFLLAIVVKYSGAKFNILVRYWKHF
jgi:hypothetical protein